MRQVCYLLNDYNRFSAEGAEFKSMGAGMAVLSMRFSYRAGRRLTRHVRVIEIPVPMSKSREAQGIVEMLGEL